ncbi:MAG: O-antigen acetylase [uncultured Thiotrichaceae bacterium]|uniref:O-antigen acetylase n=1 Tax=uncultured Thiotrichaceae bacterium TaxID=298394 RepID=A0A6S6SPC8_9GAMM|nr:MAG: O-antigen acetylase [uncultured Thiotrichaceae bacterium]
MATLQYRKEIDGLRALAVLPVILFHAGFSFMSGGFVGVDIFFVISGYLITSLIVAEIDKGTFSLVNFYERRARRILPALFLVILACLPFAWVYLLPHEMVDFGQGVVAVTVFASNILFWKDSDYFSPDAELLPLLHTWSLAVEEQYYVFFPLLLMLAWRFGKSWFVPMLLVLIAAISLALSEWLWRVDSAANFYLLPTRAWELMLGALAGLYLRSSHISIRWLREIGSLIGLIMIGLAIVLLDDSMPFPSLYALLPTLGAVFIILCADAETVVGRLLSLPIFVGVGLISYSAYLWHQPIFAFARIYGMDEPNIGIWVGLIALALLLAWGSWCWVEKPFRDRSRFSRGQIFTLAGIGSVFLIGIGMLLVLQDGFPQRF